MILRLVIVYLSFVTLCVPKEMLESLATSFPKSLEFIKVNVGVKTGGSRVEGPNLCIKADGNRKQGTQMFTQVRALSMEVKPYFLLD